MVRPDKHAYFMNIAKVVATRSTCRRRAVGCVLVDELGHILATGHNGVAKGEEHCNEGTPCAGWNASSGTNLDGCKAVHAEQNSMLQCADVNKIHACYCTASPCLTCVKMLMNTGCTAIWFSEKYPHPEAQELWTKNQHRLWLQLP